MTGQSTASPSTKIAIVASRLVGGRACTAGEVVDVSEETAVRLILDGAATYIPGSTRLSGRGLAYFSSLSSWGRDKSGPRPSY